jgi:acetyltransferase-like isoleucine patch superfamily enzyme/ubiquinone/menaquinone biosynthesis C-methylase UbiE
MNSPSIQETNGRSAVPPEDWILTGPDIVLDAGLTLALGAHSYIHDRRIRNPSGALTMVTIGKFCSIATDLTVIGYDHRSEWISMYPFLDDWHRANWPGTADVPYPQASEFGGNKNRGDIRIGNDVWIGYNVKLFKGVTIGDGAVVGACSLVNKSVEAYTIVAGTPARPIRRRFSDTEIALLQKMKWWELPDSLIDRHMKFLCSADIAGLEKALGLDPDFQNLKLFPAGISAASTAKGKLIAGQTDETQKTRPVTMTSADAADRMLEITANYPGLQPKPSIPKPIAMPSIEKTTASLDPAPLAEARVRQLAKFVGDDWKQRPYYDEAEQYMEQQWREAIWPFIQTADFSHVLDLAAGHGRNSEKLKEHAQKIHIVDINVENIEFCQKRFAGDPRFVFTQNDGCSLSFIPAASISLAYCFDAMVHFDSDVVRAYLREFARVLRPNALGFCHHSNYAQNPGGDVHRNPGWRNFMSQALFAHYCGKEGLTVVKSRVIDWELPGSDCITLFRKSAKP